MMIYICGLLTSMPPLSPRIFGDKCTFDEGYIVTFSSPKKQRRKHLPASTKQHNQFVNEKTQSEPYIGIFLFFTRPLMDSYCRSARKQRCTAHFYPSLSLTSVFKVHCSAYFILPSCLFCTLLFYFYTLLFNV